MSGLMERYRAPVLALLAVFAVAGALLFLSWRSEPVEILAPPEAGSPRGMVYVSGSVANPGLYPWEESDTVADILRAAGLEDGADMSAVKLHVPMNGVEAGPQRVNLNTAAAWLIAALPGIGETRAAAIIAYRSDNGRFRSTAELTRVSGIGAGTYDRIKDLITVSE